MGHMVSYIQTDVWVRFQKLIGNKCLYFCGEDAHGTPIMVNAAKQGITPKELINKMKAEHQQDFDAFNIHFDNYHTTDSDENRRLAEALFLKAKDKGKVYDKEIEQYFCDTCEMFLPDRFIKGTCPSCNTENQYGDNCESCGSTYTPRDLIEPKCATCDNGPVLKKSVHYFFKLSDYEGDIQKWLSGDHVKSEVKNKLNEWFDQGIKDWDISRDAPYFGFLIPGTTDKYFYVWLDAPIGYMASVLNWCNDDQQRFDDIWRNPDAEIVHFIGKDILYFHTLFWPALLMAGDYTLPAKVNVHGFLTLNGEKMSKSRGTFITAKQYLEHLNPEFLRYYFAAKLAGNMSDIDLNIEDFVYKVNSDLLGKYINIASRLGSILSKKLGGKLTEMTDEGLSLCSEVCAVSEQVKAHYEGLEYNKAMKLIMECADKTNKFINDSEPWAKVASDPDLAAAICTTGLNILKTLTIYLKPVIPGISQGVESFLNCGELSWEDITVNLTNHGINPYSHLAQRLDLEDVKEKLGF
jgi:methionyl-tRNA synthetase